MKLLITGWAQVNGRDEFSILDNVALDAEYLDGQCFWLDIKRYYRNQNLPYLKSQIYYFQCRYL